MERIRLTLASHRDLLLATAAGQVSSEELLRVLATVIDTASERGLDKILLDFSALTGELPATHLYSVGKTIAQYCATKPFNPKLAVIGKPPTVTGFGAQVASNRGLISKTFSETEEALKWLGAIGSKASGA